MASKEDARRRSRQERNAKKRQDKVSTIRRQRAQGLTHQRTQLPPKRKPKQLRKTVVQYHGHVLTSREGDQVRAIVNGILASRFPTGTLCRVLVRPFVTMDAGMEELYAVSAVAIPPRRMTGTWLFDMDVPRGGWLEVRFEAVCKDLELPEAEVPSDLLRQEGPSGIAATEEVFSQVRRAALACVKHETRVVAQPRQPDSVRPVVQRDVCKHCGAATRARLSSAS